MKKIIIIIALIIVFAIPGEKALAAPAAGDLVKLPCPAGASANDPCRAVYHVGVDGKRHAFPNQHVYFSWYDDWSGVTEISAGEMAALPLGRNVTYRPGLKLVKFPTVPQTYAVDSGGVLRWVKTEAAAQALYGANWAKTTDDISETFYTDYTFGADINTAADFDAAAVLAAHPTFDSSGGASYALQSVVTAVGTFDTHVMKLDRERYQMETLVDEDADCDNNCAVKNLAAYAADAGAQYGIHGTYFCPADYASCSSEVNTFNGPLYDSLSGYMHNPEDIFFHLAPMIAESEDGQLVYYPQAPQFGSAASFAFTHSSSLHAAIANYPGLINNGAVIVESEGRLEEIMRTNRRPRGAIGWNSDQYILAIATDATVVELAYIMHALDAQYAMNLDGGGSIALYYEGQYMVGPGRPLPNAVVFTER